jgi:CheY-like chemotaxis protein
VIAIFIANLIIQYKAGKKEIPNQSKDVVDVVNENKHLKEKVDSLLAANTKLLSMTNLGTIVCIEDDPNDTDLLRRQLKRIGLANPVVWFDSLEMAYIFIGENAVLFIMVDVSMISNGFRFLETLKDNPDTRDTPIILVSGTQVEDITGYRKGAIGYCEKPVNIEKLLNVLNLHGFDMSIRMVL